MKIDFIIISGILVIFSFLPFILFPLIGGLLLFVMIPIPGTGVYAGAIAAWLNYHICRRDKLIARHIFFAVSKRHCQETIFNLDYRVKTNLQDSFPTLERIKWVVGSPKFTSLSINCCR